MKKSISTLLAVLSIGTLVAQNNPPATNTPPGSRNTPQTSQQNTEVPPAVSKMFDTDYPNTKSTWTMAGSGYRSEYMDPNTKLSRAVIYDADGNLIGNERELGQGEYPATINKYYSTSYPNEEYRVWIREEPAGTKNYFVTRKTEVIWFDDKGNYTRNNPANRGM